MQPCPISPSLLIYGLYILLLASGFFSVWFWFRCISELRAPCLCSTNSRVQSLVHSRLYFRLFKLHGLFWVRGISFSLMFWLFYLLLLVLLNFEIDPCREGGLLVGGIIVMCGLFALMGKQGMTIRLTESLGISFDKNNYLAFHIMQPDFKVSRASLGVLITSMGREVREVRSLGLNYSFIVQSWLLVPKNKGSNFNSADLRALVSLPQWLIALYSPRASQSGSCSLGSCMACSKKRISQRIGNILGRVKIFFAMFIAASFLFCRFFSITKALKRIQVPGVSGNAGYQSTSTLSISLASRLHSQHPNCQIAPAPFEKMTWVAVFNLVVRYPQVGQQLSGLTGGFTIR